MVSDKSRGLDKFQMEIMADRFRRDLGLKPEDPFNPLQIEIDDVQIVSLDQVEGLDEKTRSILKEGESSWSAMSVPDAKQEKWVVVLNKEHPEERQKVSLLEEIWHIIQG